MNKSCTKFQHKHLFLSSKIPQDITHSTAKKITTLINTFFSFARVKLRRRIVEGKTDLEPVEYLVSLHHSQTSIFIQNFQLKQHLQESEEDEETQKAQSIFPSFVFCWHLHLLNWFLGMTERRSGFVSFFLNCVILGCLFQDQKAVFVALQWILHFVCGGLFTHNFI
jgi:hypothetical protein